MGILSGCDQCGVSPKNEKSLKCSDRYMIFFFCINGAIGSGEHKYKKNLKQNAFLLQHLPSGGYLGQLHGIHSTNHILLAMKLYLKNKTKTGSFITCFLSKAWVQQPINQRGFIVSLLCAQYCDSLSLTQQKHRS